MSTGAMLTYCLLPFPITRHEILKPMVSVQVMFLEGGIVEFVIEIWIGQHILYQGTGITKPNFETGVHPRWNFTFRSNAILVDAKIIPWHITKGCHINGIIQILVRCERRLIIIFK